MGCTSIVSRKERNYLVVGAAFCALMLAGLKPTIAQESASDSTLLHWNSDQPKEGGPPGPDEPLASDRPDFTEASSTVGRGVLQVEMGYTHFKNHDPTSHVESHSYPELLLRAGILAEWFELRLGWNFGSETDFFDPLTRTSSGSEDLYLGAKLGLTPQQGICPEMALLPQMTVPLGGAFGAGEVLPGINWLYGWDVSDCLSTAGSTQINMSLDGETDDKYLEFAQSWTIGYALADRVGAFTEWFMLSPSGAETDRTQHYFDGGFTYSVTNNLQLDVRAGKGVSAAAIDWFTGAGTVVRF